MTFGQDPSAGEGAMSGPVSDVRPVPPKKRRTGVMGFVAFWSLAASQPGQAPELRVTDALESRVGL